MVETSKERRATKNRLTLTLLAIAFVLPVGLASLLYAVGWRPAATINHGELIEPPRVISDLELRTLEGKRLRLRDLQGKWTFIYFGPARCLAACEHNLYKMRQVRLAQGEKAERVQRVFVVTDTRAIDLLTRVLQDYPGLVVITGSSTAVRTLAQEFVLPAGMPLDGLERIYLMDPTRRLMMSYPSDADASGMRKDLARLLDSTFGGLPEKA
ncbi:MAG: SCO family protein, partial [Acidiferrobacterales bacterium]